jgi:hypothetical protein
MDEHHFRYIIKLTPKKQNKTLMLAFHFQDSPQKEEPKNGE